jgi:hypothetical protein
MIFEAVIKTWEEPDCEINRVGGTSCEFGSVPFAETLQKSCGTLVDAKGHPVVDGKSRLSPIAQDVLSMFLLTLSFCFSRLRLWTYSLALLLYPL